MDYALGMCCSERISNLNCEFQHLVERKRLARNAVRQSLPKSRDRYSSDPEAFCEFVSGLRDSYSNQSETLLSAVEHLSIAVERDPNLLLHMERDLGYNPYCVTRCGGRPMRGGDLRSEALFSYLSCEARVPLDHPLRPIQKIVDEALGALTGEFEKLYAKLGRPSIPPEKLLRALLLQAFYSVRSERQLMEQLGYNCKFRSFRQAISVQTGRRFRWKPTGRFGPKRHPVANGFWSRLWRTAAA